MENMDKGLTAPKWPKIPQNLSAQVLDFNEKRLHWVSVVRGHEHVPGGDFKSVVFYESNSSQRKKKCPLQGISFLQYRSGKKSAT